MFFRRFWKIAFPIALFFLSRVVSAQPVLNEIMYAPKSPEPEWIELYNPGLDTIDLAGWKFSNNTKSIALGSYLLPGNSYVIVTKDSTGLRAKRPGNYPIIQAALFALTNTGDNITLKDSNNRTIDSLYYFPSWGGQNGISLERKNFSRPAMLPSNWASSIDSSGATPGARNSIAYPHDLALTAVATPTDSSLIITLVNTGIDSVFRTTIIINTGLDTIVRNVELQLATGDSTQITFAQSNDFFGLLHCVAFISDTLDQDASNDSLHLSLYAPIPADSLVINEIMLQPMVGSCEWIELYNASSRIIAMEETNLDIGNNSLRIKLTTPPFFIPANSYGLLAADTTILTRYPEISPRQEIAIFNRSSLDLSNDSSSIVLLNQDHSSIDSVRYFASWQVSPRPSLTGISLERKRWNGPSNDPQNWQACVDSAGATPLAANSIAENTDTSSATIFSAHFDPNPFSPDGDGFQDQSILTIQSGDEVQYAMRVRMFDMRGRQIKTLADAIPYYRSATLILDGRNDNGQIMPMGLYTVLIELSSQSPLRLLKKVIGVAIAGRRR
jgi:hypothetical protein